MRELAELLQFSLTVHQSLLDAVEDFAIDYMLAEVADESFKERLLRDYDNQLQPIKQQAPTNSASRHLHRGSN